MGSGNCVFWAPETFDLSDDGHAVVVDAAATEEERLRSPRRAVPSAPSPSGAPAPRFLWRRTRNADRRHRGPRVAAHHRAALGPDPLPGHACRGRPPRRRPGRRTCRRPGRRWPPRAGSACTCPRSRAGQGFTLSELAVVLEELGHAFFPGPAAADAAGLRRAGPRVAWAGRRCRRSGCAGWPTAPSRPPWRWARLPQHWQPAGGRGARAGGHGAPGARAAHGPAGPGARSTTAPGAERAGSCSTGRRWVTPSPSRHCRRSTPPAPVGQLTIARGRPDGAAGASRCCSPTTTSAAWP